MDRNPVYLDKLQVERQRGITVKAQAATMLYTYKGEEYMLNLIDTPGHVDFNYEVSRSLRACEGAILLVDAIKGIQAQTMANFWLAYEADLQIVSAVNKVDMKNALPGLVTQQITTSFGIPSDDILHISAKTGLRVFDLLERTIEKIPPPKVGTREEPLRAFLFDSWYGNDWSGVVCLIKVRSGVIKHGDTIRTYQGEKEYTVTDVGIMYPEQESTGILYPGQVGYFTCNMKSTGEAMVGDTVYSTRETRDQVTPFEGFKKSTPMVFGGLYPADEGDFNNLAESIEKLALTDRAVTIQKDTNDILGLGFRCGFLGMLHMEVFSQRLRQEHGTSVISTAPQVTFKVQIERTKEWMLVSTPSDWPEGERLIASEEPRILATIVTPKEHMGAVLKLVTEKRGEQHSLKFIDETRVVMKYYIPLVEMLQQFFDKLKSTTSGYASLDYEDGGYAPSDLVKVTIMLNGKPVPPLSLITHRSRAYEQGKTLAQKLKGTIRRQLFEVAIQAAIGSKVIARETIKAYRKDVTAKCYGGDITRKRKLLERQKEGKKEMKSVGNIKLSQEAFMTVLNL
eukprot:TRINITY_DN3712_c0_g1_i1.p1 TRINITY_DN3712_c0_g1~~TRINITY_DN3712_c0_g1_i1.p1  ORF type:complete len:660 (-),score=158.04 TRINITY_DN3712_c0_g1_i1:39-1739(-)